MRTVVVLVVVSVAAVAHADPMPGPAPAADPPPKRKAVAEAAPVEVPPAPTMLLALGGERGVADGLGPMPSARIELRFPAGLVLGAAVGAKSEPTFRETSSLFLAGYRRDLVRGTFAAWVGAEAGGGLITQTPTDAKASYSATAVAAPNAGLAVRVTGQTSLALEGAVNVAALRRDGATVLLALPGAWLGLLVDL